MADECVLFDRKCCDCGQCDVCDLDSGKICDDCGQCIEEGREYRTLDIQEFITAQQEKKRNKE